MADDIYGSMGSVPNVLPQGGGAEPYHVQATPEAAGSAIGRGLEAGGKQLFDIYAHNQDLANHTAVNDSIVNNYVPQVNSIESEYKKLSGIDAVAQLPDYQKKLLDINNQYLNSAANEQQKQMLGNFITHHSTQQMSMMSNHSDQQYMQHEKIIYSQTMQMTIDDASNNWQNPANVAYNVDKAHGMSTLQGLSKIGHDDESIPIVNQMANEQSSKVAVGAIKMALDNNNDSLAIEYKNKYNDIITGSDKLDIEKKIISVTNRVNGINIVSNLLGGNPAIPQGTQQHYDTQVKSNIASIAIKQNFPANILFALHGVESSYGKGITNESRLKDDFQTDPKYRDPEFPGDDMDSSAHNAMKIWNTNSDVLSKGLGRELEPKEGYIAYNQGGTGALALFNASPADTAVEALVNGTDLTLKEATQHVLKNGGTATMSASDFSNHLKDIFQSHYDGQKVTVDNNSSIPDAIRNQGNIRIPAMQEINNPHDFLKQMESRYEVSKQAIDAIPDDSIRDSAYKEFKKRYSEAKFADNIWKNNQTKIVDQYADDPKYTSIEQLPISITSDLRAAGQLSALDKRLKEKINISSNKSLGSGFLEMAQAITSQNPDIGIDNIAKLNEIYGTRDDIDNTGYKKLNVLLKKSQTSDGRAEVTNQIDFLSKLKKSYYPTDSMDDKKKLDAAIDSFFVIYNGASDKSSILSMDIDKNTFLKSLNLPTKAEVTNKKMMNVISVIEQLRNLENI